MKKIKLLLPFLMLLISQGVTYSQTDITSVQKKHSLHFGAVFPLGKFADDDMDYNKSSGAATGVNIGYEFIYPLSDGGLGLFACIDINYNELQKSIKDSVDELWGSSMVERIDVKLPKYLNIPISTGLNYTFKGNEKLSLYGDLGVLFNILKMTDYIVDGNFNGGNSFGITTKVDLANSFGYKLGGGLIINKKIVLSINYFSLGEPEINGEHKLYNEGVLTFEEEIEDYKPPIDFLTLTIGLKF